MRKLLLVGIPALILAGVAVGAAYLWSLPGVGDAEARVQAILAAHRCGVEAGPPPVRLADAVVAVEDEHFYSNVAVNIADGAGRAALATLQGGGDPGGSTIDQQLAKLLYPHGSGFGGTLEEIGLAVKLSLEYPPRAILSMYLNAAYFGNGYWGYSAAARGYFGRSPRQLSWSQAAMLAGLLQAPSAYDPLRHLRAARTRQRQAVDQLVDNHYLSPGRGRAVLAEPLGLRSERPAGRDRSGAAGRPLPGTPGVGSVARKRKMVAPQPPNGAGP
ncbi:MAG: transglycosylase domain-containing protein [Syntrophothermus sp.]